MYAWIPLLCVALLFTGIHKILRHSTKVYRDMELMEGEGVITKSSQESNRNYFYVEFEADGNIYREKVFGSYPLKPPYKRGDQVPIGYHIDEKGQATVFIDDEDLEKIKHGSDSKLFLNIAIGMYIAAGAFFVYFLMNL